MPIFMKFDGIDGESFDKGHEKWIELLSYQWGIAQTARLGSGAGTGMVVPQDFSFNHHVDKASPKLFGACATGRHVSFGQFDATTAEGPVFLKYKFYDLLITSWENSGEGSNRPTEEVSFNYTKVDIDYFPMSPDGTLGGAVSSSFDFRRAQAE